MSTFTVEPSRLRDPAMACERAAESLAGAARAVVGVVVPTGRPDSELATVYLLQSLGAAVQHRADAAQEVARLLTTARERYEAAEHRARGG